MNWSFFWPAGFVDSVFEDKQWTMKCFRNLENPTKTWLTSLILNIDDRYELEDLPTKEKDYRNDSQLAMKNYFRVPSIVLLFNLAADKSTSFTK